MAAEIHVDAIGERLIDRTMTAIIARFGNMRELNDRFGTVLETSTIERFDDEKDPEGVAWLPSRRAEEEGGKTLTDTARLKLSIHHVASATQAQVGTNVIYAGIHNDGGTITAKGGGRLAFKIPGLGFVRPMSVTMPKRTFIGLSADDREELAAQAVDYVAEIDPSVQP